MRCAAKLMAWRELFRLMSPRCMYVCMYVCMYGCVRVLYVCGQIDGLDGTISSEESLLYVCMYVYMYVCMYECMRPN